MLKRLYYSNDLRGRIAEYLNYGDVIDIRLAMHLPPGRLSGILIDNFMRMYDAIPKAHCWGYDYRVWFYWHSYTRGVVHILSYNPSRSRSRQFTVEILSMSPDGAITSIDKYYLISDAYKSINSSCVCCRLL